MKSAYVWKKIFKGLRSVVLSVLFVIWSIGMFTGGVPGLAAAAVGIPVAIGLIICD